MIIRFLAAVLLLVASSAVEAQVTANDRARAYYVDAATAFEKRNYDRTLQSLQKAVDALGKSNARIAALQVKAHVAKKDFKAARRAIDAFYGFPASDQLVNEMSSSGLRRLRRNVLPRKPQKDVKS